MVPPEIHNNESAFLLCKYLTLVFILDLNTNFKIMSIIALVTEQLLLCLLKDCRDKNTTVCSTNR